MSFDPVQMLLANKVISGGVLCWSIPPGTKDIYFLLGKERKNRKWRQGSNRWSDFGGGAKSNETVFDCATREFVEESLACLQVLPDQYTSSQDLADVSKKLLSTSVYTAAIQLYVYPKKDKEKDKVTEGQEKVNHDENDTSNIVTIVPQQPNDDDNWRDHSQNGTKVKAISIPAMLPLPAGQELPKGTKTRVCFLKFVPWQPAASRYFLKIHRYLQRLYTFIGKPNAEEKMTPEHLKNVIQMYETLPYSIRKHPAIVITRHQTTSAITSIKVNSDYLEKQQIMWWSLPMIQKVIENNGSYNKFVLRKGFLPLLKIAVDILTKN